MVQNRKNQILAEATRLFSRYGYDRVTIRDLADACGITEPALYRYFPSKESLYDTVLDSLTVVIEYEKLFSRLAAESDLKIIMDALAQHILDFFKKHRELYRLLLYSTLREHRKARQVFRSIRYPFVEFLNNKLDELRQKGLIREKNNQITARCFVGMIFDCSLSATLWKGFQGRFYRLDEVIENNVSIFVEGLKI